MCLCFVYRESQSRVASLSKNAIIKTDTVFIVLGNAITIMIGVQFRHVDDDKKANNVVPSLLRYLILSATI